MNKITINTKIFFTVICPVVSIAGCRQTNKTADVLFHVCFTDLQALNRLPPNIITGNEQALSDSALQQLFSDTTIYRAEDGCIRYNDDLLAVIKAIDDKHIFAIACNNADTVIIVPEDWDRNNIRTLEYYETDDYSQPLQLIFSETFNSKNKKHRKYWEHFLNRKIQYQPPF